MDKSTVHLSSGPCAAKGLMGLWSDRERDVNCAECRKHINARREHRNDDLVPPPAEGPSFDSPDPGYSGGGGESGGGGASGGW